MGMLWHEAEAALAGIVERVIHYDADGLDVYFLNSQQSLRGVKDPAAIRELFQYVGPVGESTPTEVRVRVRECCFVRSVDLLSRSRSSCLPTSRLAKGRNGKAVPGRCQNLSIV